MKDDDSQVKDYGRVERAIRFLEGRFERRPDLADVAEAAGLSEHGFRGLLGRWAGMDPKCFLRFLTQDHARKRIEDTRNLLGAADGSGPFVPGGRHDLFVAHEAVTPGRGRHRGQGMTALFGFHPSPFGRCLLAVTDRGICALEFLRGQEDPADLVNRLRRQWPMADLEPDPERTGEQMPRIFGFPLKQPPAPLHLYVKGTPFQIKVWEALLSIPLGGAVTYSDIARHIGLPGATRAVGNAVGRNPISFLIPCHRVIRKTGDFGYYGGGPARKKAMLAWEAALTSPANGPPAAKQ